MVKASDDLLAIATRGIEKLAKEVATEIGRKPSIPEMLEIITLGLKSLSFQALVDVRAADVIALKLNKTAGAGTEARSAVAELNDHAFVSASDLITELSECSKKEHGQAPTLAEFCRVLEQALGAAGGVLGVGLSPSQKVKAELRKSKAITGKVGDVIAIPAKNQQYFIAVLLTRNGFGLALGLFEGTSVIRSISLEAHPPVRPRPIYAGEEFIENGRWKIIGHDEALLSLFPKDPEIYHYQHKDRPRASIGPFGSGETTSGRLRTLTEAEAEEIGLLDGTYQQVYLPDLLENHLNASITS